MLTVFDLLLYSFLASGTLFLLVLSALLALLSVFACRYMRDFPTNVAFENHQLGSRAASGMHGEGSGGDTTTSTHAPCESNDIIPEKRPSTDLAAATSPAPEKIDHEENDDDDILPGSEKYMSIMELGSRFKTSEEAEHIARVKEAIVDRYQFRCQLESYVVGVQVNDLLKELANKSFGIFLAHAAGMALGERRHVFTKKDARNLVQIFNDHVCLKEQDIVMKALSGASKVYI